MNSIIDTILHEPVYLYEIFAMLAIYPTIRIFQRAGLKEWYAILLPVPVAGLIACLGILALSRWSVQDKKD